jgi:hypothetical protein
MILNITTIIKLPSGTAIATTVIVNKMTKCIRNIIIVQYHKMNKIFLYSK